MNDHIPREIVQTTNDQTMASELACLDLDARRPKLLDHHGHVLQVTKGHVDVFAVERGSEARPRANTCFGSSKAVCYSTSMEPSPGSTSLLSAGWTRRPRYSHACRFGRSISIEKWITQLAQLIAGPNPDWNMREVADQTELAAGERRRGPARNIVWVSLGNGAARLMGLYPTSTAGAPPLPLTSGMWIEASQSGCSVVADTNVPEAETIWNAVDQFHRCIGPSLSNYLLHRGDGETDRIARRGEIMTAQNLESFDRLAAIVVRRFDQANLKTNSTDPLLSACQIVAETIQTPVDVASRSTSGRQGLSEVVEIARAARLRVRQTLLRGTWWKQDVGPLVTWHGEQRDPVALVRGSRGRYTMIKTDNG